MSHKKYIVIDIETTGLKFKDDKIVSLGLKNLNTGEYLYYENPNFKTNPEGYKNLLNELNGYENQGYEFVFHNGSFDTKFLRANGFTNVTNDHDTMIMAYLLKKGPKKLSLDSLVSYYLGLPSWKEDLKPEENADILDAMMNNPTDERIEVLDIYTKTDVEYTGELFELLKDQLIKEDRWDFYLQLMKARRVLTDAEFYGILFDKEEAEKYLVELEVEKATKLADLNMSLIKHLDRKPINWRSSKQVLQVFKDLGLKVVDPVTKKESAGKRVQEMNKNKHEIAGMLYDYKKVDKKITSIGKYLTEHTDDFGVINANFNVSNVRTGRLSSSSPNLQQVDSSASMRKLFKVPKGKALIVGDMAQIEVRMAAHYSNDPTLKKVFTDEIDFYGVIANEVLDWIGDPNSLKERDKQTRDVAKVIGLSILYGCGVNRLRNGIKEATGRDIGYSRAKEIIDNYFNSFSGLKKLRKGVDRVLTDRGFIKNLYGRQIDISPDKIYMTGVNSLLQSSASDLLLFRSTEFMEKYGDRCELLALVHDEILIECAEEDAEELMVALKVIMERTDDINFRIPLKFDCGIGTDWSVK